MAFVKPQTNTDDQTTITGNSSQDQVVTPSINNTSGGVVDTTAGSNSTPGTGAAAIGTSVSDKNAQGGKGMFTNLKTYLDKNDTGAANLGDTLSGNINQQTDAANSAVNNAQTDFNNSVSGSTVNYNNDLWNSVANDASQYADNNDVKQGLSGTYTGPTDITGTDAGKTAQSALTNAQTTGLLGKNVEGRTQLLDNIFNTGENTPKTTTGGLGLDQFLIQNTEPAFNKVTDAVTATGDPLTDTYKGVLDTSLQTVKDARQTNLDTRNQALSRLGQGQTDLQKQVTDELIAKQKAADDAAAALNAQRQQTLNIINSGQAGLGQQAADLLGISLDQLNSLQSAARDNINLGGQGATIGNYLTGATAGKLGTADVITPEQLEDLKALGLLQGVDINSFIQNGLGGGNQGGINYSGLSNDINQQLAAGQERARQAEIARQAEVARQAAIAEQQRQAQAAADAEAARIAQYSQPTGNPWADAANQAYLRGDLPSYNYYMLLAKQLNGYMQTQNRIAANNPGPIADIYGRYSDGGDGSAGTGNGNGSTGPVGPTSGNALGTVGGLATGLPGIAVSLGLQGITQGINSTPPNTSAPQNSPPEGSVGAPGGSPDGVGGTSGPGNGAGDGNGAGVGVGNSAPGDGNGTGVGTGGTAGGGSSSASGGSSSGGSGSGSGSGAGVGAGDGSSW
jgi:hypothetical protein